MAATLLLDTNIWTDLLLGSDAEQARVMQALTALGVRHGALAIATSRICIAEALVAARRHVNATKRQAEEAVLWVAFQKPGLRVVELTETVAPLHAIDIANHAAELRAHAIRHTLALKAAAAVPADGGKLKLPDAIVAASCFAFDPPAVLFTKNRRDFELSDGHGGTLPLAGLAIEAL